jgi:hypothetical protein
VCFFVHLWGLLLPLVFLSRLPRRTPQNEAKGKELLLTVLGDSGRLGQSKVTVLEERQVSNGVLGKELGGLVVALHGERLVVVELNTSKGGSG